MQRVFFGLVLPERSDVSIAGPITIESNEPSPYKIIMSILRSQIHATCTWDESVNLSTFKNIVEFQARLIVDAIGLHECCGYDMEIISAIDPVTGAHDVFGVQETLDINKGFPDFVEMVKKAGREPALYVALANFREAIRVPHETSLYCYRAIEAIRQVFVPEGVDRDSGSARIASWSAMRQALNLLEDTIRESEPFAKSSRHGQLVEQPWSLRKRHMEIAHEIIRRFTHLRCGNLTQLGGEFPQY